MVKEAAEHEAEDKKRREEIERRNKLDNLCYTLEKTITENKDKLPASDVATLEGLIKEGRAAIEKQDDAKVKDVSARSSRRKRTASPASCTPSGAPRRPWRRPAPRRSARRRGSSRPADKKAARKAA